MKRNLFTRRLMAFVLCFGLLLSMFAGVVAFGEGTGDEGDLVSSVNSEIEEEENVASQPDGDAQDDVSSQLEDDPDAGIMPAADGYTYAATGWRYADENNAAVYIPELKTSVYSVSLRNGTGSEAAEAWMSDLLDKNPVAWAYFNADNDRIGASWWRMLTLSGWEKADWGVESEVPGWRKYVYTTRVTGVSKAPARDQGYEEIYELGPEDRFTVEGIDSTVLTIEFLIPEDPNNIPKQDRYAVTTWNFNNLGGYIEPDMIPYYGLNLSEQTGYDPGNPQDFDFEGFVDTLKANSLYQEIKVWRRDESDYPKAGVYGDWFHIPVYDWVYEGPLENEYYTGYLYRAETDYQFYWDANGQPTDFYIFLLDDSAPITVLPGVTRWNFNGAEGFLNTGMAFYELPDSEKASFNPANPEALAAELMRNPLYQKIKINRARDPIFPPVGRYGDWGDIEVKEWKYELWENEFYTAHAYKAVTDYEFFWNSDGEPADFYICIPGDYKYPLSQTDLNKHIVEAQEPSALQINLFDYWTDANDHLNEGEITDPDIADRGINAGHHFKFRDSSNYNLNNNEVGAWNANNALDATGGLVESQLVNGYPKLRLDQLEPVVNGTYPTSYTVSGDDNTNALTESLAYLFSPDEKYDGNGRNSYIDVNGLLRLDDDGNYAFSARKNYAYYDVSQGDGGDFTLLDTWGVIADGDSPNGQFFPFVNPLEATGFPNTAVFIGEENGALVQAQKRTENHRFGFDSNSPGANHWMGMTLETGFVQPFDGRLNLTTPMTFSFRGDDDIWVFIDDVLVIDISGIHSTIGAKIDFSTGEVTHFPVNADGYDENNYNGTRGATTLKALFEAALGNNPDDDRLDEEEWNGDTFATYTEHTLKMFFLERGGVDSNFALTYNLVQPNADRVRKVDENGDPIEGVIFDIYTSNADGEQGTYLARTTTDSTGHGDFLNEERLPISFAEMAAKYDTNYFLLREINTPAGYRANPDLILKLDTNTRTFTVVNKWQTGAYGSFTANFIQNGMSGLKTEDGTETISQQELLDGLVLVVPCLTPKEGGLLPMYGSNTVGWDVVQTDQIGEPSAIVEAAVRHMRSGPTVQDYYLTWEEGDKRLQGALNNLPGDPTRYAQNGGGEAVGKYLFLSQKALSHFDSLGFNVGSQANADDRYAKLKRAVNTQEGFDAIMSLINQPEQYAHDLALLSASGVDEEGKGTGFERDYRSVIYVPNEQRKLHVRKVDSDGNPVEGAVFAIFNTAKQAAEYTPTANTAEGIINELRALENDPNVGLRGVGQTKILDGANAMLTFEENGDDDPDDGIAHIDWPDRQYVGDNIPDTDDSVFWMRELYAPPGYEVNPYLIRIAGGDQAIYAHATGFKFDEATQKGVLLDEDERKDDHIRVQSGLGTLAQTLVKYAASDYVDITLRDITIYKQKQVNQTEVLGEWVDDPDAPEYNLHYGRNNEGLTGQYGLHDEQFEEGQVPVYIVDDGYVRVMPRQNTDFGGYIPADGSFTDLTDVDLNALFGLLNIVIVEDPLVAPAVEIEKWEAVTGTTAANGTELTAAPQQDEVLQVASGDTVTYYFKISNPGTMTAEQVTFSDELPETNGLQLQFVPGSAKQYTDAWTGGVTVAATETDGVVTITGLGDLAAGGELYLSFDAKIPTEVDGSSISRAIAWTNRATAAFEADHNAVYWVIAGDAAEALYGPQQSNRVHLATGPVGALSVSKTVSGKGADEEQDFTFTVTLTGEGAENVNGEYDGVAFYQGVGTFTLHHGQSKIFEALPAGLSYKVVETRDKDYTVSKKGDAGEIPEGGTAVAAFVNKKKQPVVDEEEEDPEGEDPGEDDPNEDDPGDEPDDGNEDGEGDENLPSKPEPSPSPDPDVPSKTDPDHPQTGDPGNLGLWVGLTASSGTGLLVTATGFLPKRKKKYRHMKNKYRHMR